MKYILSLFSKLKITKIKRHYKGATLVELLIYMGILSLFLGVLTSLFATSMDIQTESSATTSVDRDANYIFARLSYDLHRAESISTPASIGATNASLVLVIDGVTYTYSVDGAGNLTYTNPLGTFNLNSYDTTLSNLSFVRYGNVGGIEDTIRVSFTITSVFTPNRGIESKNVQTTIGLRRQI